MGRRGRRVGPQAKAAEKVAQSGPQSSLGSCSKMSAPKLVSGLKLADQADITGVICWDEDPDVPGQG